MVRGLNSKKPRVGSGGIAASEFGLARSLALPVCQE